MKIWKILAWLILSLVVGAIGLYMGGRIILPEMGLQAPGFWPWFWFNVITVSAFAAVKLMTVAVNGLGKQITG